MMKKGIYAFLLIPLMCISATVVFGGSVHWTYSGPEGSEHWGYGGRSLDLRFTNAELFSTCLHDSKSPHRRPWSAERYNCEAD